VAEEKRFAKATWQIMETLLEIDNLEDALAGSLEIIVHTLNSEAGAIWFLDTKTDRLSPLFHIGPVDISNITVENGLGLEGLVTKTGKSVMVEDAATDPRFDGTVFDDNGLSTKTMICVPLNNLHDVIGCVQIVNKKDGSLYDAEVDSCYVALPDGVMLLVDDHASSKFDAAGEIISIPIHEWRAYAIRSTSSSCSPAASCSSTPTAWSRPPAPKRSSTAPSG